LPASDVFTSNSSTSAEITPSEILPTLDFYTFPAGNADCLVLKTPGGRWGIVDCGLSNLNPKLRNPEKLWTTIDDLKNFLRERGVTRLAFVQLTHPEQDHYRGFYELLKDFDVDIFCTVLDTLARTKLEQLGELVDRKEQNNQLKTVEALPNTDIWAEPEYSFKLTTLTPSQKDIYAFALGASRLIKSYQPDFVNALEEDIKKGEGIKLGELITHLENTPNLKNSVPYNRLSIISLATFGQNRLLLGADAITATWRELAKTPMFSSEIAPKAAVFKYPHHGAKDGLPMDLTNNFLQQNARVTISSSGHGFTSPAYEVLSGLTLAGHAPYCTGRSSFCRGRPIGRTCTGLIKTSLTANGKVIVESSDKWREQIPVLCDPQQAIKSPDELVPKSNT
jgi:beta-lactamase superfamily II metal-dependent hydrolase